MGDPPRQHRPSASYQSPVETPHSSGPSIGPSRRTSDSAAYPSSLYALGQEPLGHVSYPTLHHQQDINSAMHHVLQHQQQYQEQNEHYLTSQFGGSLAVTPEDAGSEASSTTHQGLPTALAHHTNTHSQRQSNNNSAMVSSSSLMSGGGTGAVGGGLTRHVTAVMTHFTNSKVALSRLLGELDDCLFILSVSGTLLWTSPSTQKALGESNVSGTLQKPFLLLVHENDRRAFLSHIAETLSAPGSAERTTHLRILCGLPLSNASIEQSPTMAVWEIRSRLASDPGSPRVILCAAREYQNKASLALDSVLDLRVENYKLRKTLVDLLEKKGLDPGSHPLLQDPRKDPGLSKGLFPPALQIGGSVLAPQASSLSATSLSVTPLSASSNAFGQSSGRTPQTASLSSPGSYLPQSSAIAAVSSTSHSTDTANASAIKAVGGARQLPSIVCRHCGTQESPEWRKGPDGPRTLCNACGLAYSKKLRKLRRLEQSLSSTAASSSQVVLPLDEAGTTHLAKRLKETVSPGDSEPSTPHMMNEF